MNDFKGARQVSCLIYECKEGGEGEVVDIGQVDRWLVRQLGKELSELNEMKCFIFSNNSNISNMSIISKPEPET